MKKPVALLLAVLLILSTVTAFAEVYKDKPTVKAVQQALNDAGYNCGTPDGSAGKKTKAAITQFQTDKGLEVTGQVDDVLLEALGITSGETEAQENEDDASSDTQTQTPSDKELINDLANLANYYNGTYIKALTDLGIDVENEDIGQQDYCITQVFDPDYMLGEKIEFGISSTPATLVTETGEAMNATSSFMVHITYSEENSIGIAEYAAIRTVIDIINTYYGGTDDNIAKALAQLGDAPDRDSRIPVANLDLPDIDLDLYVLHVYFFSDDVSISDIVFDKS